MEPLSPDCKLSAPRIRMGFIREPIRNLSPNDYCERSSTNLSTWGCYETYSSPDFALLFVHMHHLRRWKTVEPCRRGAAVSANVFRINQILDFQVWQFFGERDGVQRITGLPEHRADLPFAALECLQMILAMIENDAAEGVINAVVNVI